MPVLFVRKDTTLTQQDSAPCVQLVAVSAMVIIPAPSVHLGTHSTRTKPENATSVSILVLLVHTILQPVLHVSTTSHVKDGNVLLTTT